MRRACAFWENIARRTFRRGFRAARRGFTLLELLIVGALITLMAGIAIINISQFFDDASQKAMAAEAHSIATAMSLAHDDLGFFPRINVLGKATSLITFSQSGQTFLRPGIDLYGYFPATASATNVLNSWKGPYGAMTLNRATANMLCKMRLTDNSFQSFPEEIGGESLRNVLWPCDKFHSPWMIYCVVSDPAVVTANNPLGLRLVNSATESGTYFNAVVSYGKNHIPGGNIDTPTNDPFVTNVLIPSMLYINGDVAGGDADFSLKSMTSSYAATLINPTTFNPLLAQSLNSSQTGENLGGMLDKRKLDDTVIQF